MKLTMMAASLSTVEVEKSGRSEKRQSGTDTERKREKERGGGGRVPCDSCGGEPVFCQESMKLTP